MKQAIKSTLLPRLPFAAVIVVAIIGAFTLRDHLSFETLRDNREALIAFRDANLFLALLGFSLTYVVIVAFSLPGATIATLTGGFLFGTMLGTAVNVTSATLGAILIFLAARSGIGEGLKEKMGEGKMKRT